MIKILLLVLKCHWYYWGISAACNCSGAGHLVLDVSLYINVTILLNVKDVLGCISNQVTSSLLNSTCKTCILPGFCHLSAENIYFISHVGASFDISPIHRCL